MRRQIAASMICLVPGQVCIHGTRKQAKQFGSTAEGLAPGPRHSRMALNAAIVQQRGLLRLRWRSAGRGLAKNADMVAAAYDNFIVGSAGGRRRTKHKQRRRF
jgi:hypothetical protein